MTVTSLMHHVTEPEELHSRVSHTLKIQESKRFIGLVEYSLSLTKH